jgi:hypothetical protein
VYCASSEVIAPSYRAVGRETGKLLAERGIAVVYGGGNVGLMKDVADGALAAGGEVIGVIPNRLRDRELAHEGATEMIVVDSMHARKQIMASLSDAFMALPGGYGTLDEVFEAVTWTQLGYHEKPVGLVDVDGFYEPLVRFLDEAAARGFIREAHRGLLVHEKTPEALLDTLAALELPSLTKWIDRP